MPTFDQRQEVERIRREREWAEKAQPVVITGVRIPFWTLVWWIAGITAGVSLVHAAFDWIFRLVVGLVAGTPDA
jgi:fatty acid desaturase